MEKKLTMNPALNVNPDSAIIPTQVIVHQSLGISKLLSPVQFRIATGTQRAPSVASPAVEVTKFANRPNGNSLPPPLPAANRVPASPPSLNTSYPSRPVSGTAYLLYATWYSAYDTAEISVRTLPKNAVELLVATAAEPAVSLESALP